MHLRRDWSSGQLVLNGGKVKRPNNLSVLRWDPEFYETVKQGWYIHVSNWHVIPKVLCTQPVSKEGPCESMWNADQSVRSTGSPKFHP